MISNEHTRMVHARIEELTAVARDRMRHCSTDIVGPMGGAEIDFLTEDEKRERHSLLLSLPSSSEEMLAANERIRLRIAGRKSRN